MTSASATKLDVHQIELEFAVELKISLNFMRKIEQKEKI